MKAYLKNYRQSPRKVRSVANTVKGKRVSDALVILSFLPKRAALPLTKLVESAVANARAQGVSVENLVVSSIRVDKGIVLKRRLPRARGMATPINKRNSHVAVVLAEKAPKVKKGKATVEKAAAPKAAPKKVTKKKVAAKTK